MSKILVIDDENDVREVLTRVLERAGYDVLSAADGSSGLDLCRSELPDVVITDIIMPAQSGVDIIRTLRAEYPKMGIVAISGGGNAGVAGYQPEAIKTVAYMAAAEEAGADCCLTKPFERVELLDGVAALLARQ